ncbi:MULTISPECIES: hypothetical protein [unclassified Thiocapsa]|uniref:hypothetical protein n=1 Tax=unclassified Thiocapsa TaxID=2641286 RepID=UPI0035AE60E1
MPASTTSCTKPLSPYAVTKVVNELYADVFARAYGLDSIGLRGDFRESIDQRVGAT